MPNLVFHSLYTKDGFIQQFFDGFHQQPNVQKRVIVESNSYQESQKYFAERKFHDSTLDVIPGPNVCALLQHSLLVENSFKPLNRYCVYQNNVSANEVAFGYFVIKEQHPLIENEVLEVVSRVTSYAFNPGDKIGFVLFPRSWNNETGFKPKWNEAIWSEPQLNPDAFRSQNIKFPQYHYASYIRDPELLLPLSNSVQFFSVEDSRSDWKSDRDFNDFAFMVMDGGYQISVHHDLELSDQLKVEPDSKWQGDIAVDGDGILAVIGIPETNAVVLCSLISRKSLFTLNPSTECKYFGSSVLLSQDKSLLIVGAPGENGMVFIYSLSFDGNNIDNVDDISSKITCIAIIIAPWPNSHIGCQMALNTDATVLALIVENATGTECAQIYTKEKNWGLDSILNIPIQTDQTVKSKFSIAMSGNGKIITIGSPEAVLATGHVWSYIRTRDNNWSEPHIVLGLHELLQSSNAQIGYAVSLNNDGSKLAITAPSTNQDMSTLFVLTRSSNGLFSKESSEFIVDSRMFSPSFSLINSRFFHGTYVKFVDDDSILQVNRDVFDDDSFVTSVNLFKKVNNVWTLIQSPIMHVIETKNWYRSPKIAISGNGKVCLARDLPITPNSFCGIRVL